MSLRKLCVLLLAVAVPTGSAYPFAPLGSRRANAKTVQANPARIKAFQDSIVSNLAHIMPSSCEQSQAATALATPAPFLADSGAAHTITVNFIIGTDGRVHSPLILESASPLEDLAILETIRAWRYRPAICNGVPTEAEANIEFSSR